ncbi:LysR substrate-binding domain-containing protein [Sinorhizobium medicae]|uniref:LysR substrate-binding domain-containing protein n=1 Tax=Sinorhizobium medicae TaxID=110321 RepID=UPI001F22B13F|nr:LysR substrate-binding domain-containing protein [Sinorhizobium medicae]
MLTQSIEHIVGTWQEIQGAMARKRLHVSAYDAFSTLWLAPRLPLFRAENPELSIFVDTQDHDPDLRRNDFDLALRFGDGHWSDGEAIFLFRDEIVPVCSPGYLRELPPMTTPDSMKAHSIIDYSRGGRAWQCWEDWTQFAFGRPIEARTDTYLQLLHGCSHRRGGGTRCRARLEGDRRKVSRYRCAGRDLARCHD